MPFIITRPRRGRLVAALTGLALFATVSSANADTTAANPLGCTPQPALVQPFAAWGDGGDYTLAPGGDFEHLLNGWVLTPGARIVGGNEPFYVGSADDDASLLLPSGSLAVSSPICIDDTYPWFRMFARNTGDLKSKLRVDILYLDTKGRLSVRGSGEVKAASNAWTPTDTLKIDLDFAPSSVGGAAPVAFRFTAEGKGGLWQIDDVYVDPMARGSR